MNAISSCYDHASSLGKDRGIADLFRHYFSDESSISQDCSTWKTNKYINVSQFPGGSSSEMKIGSVAYCIVFQSEDRISGLNVLLRS
ncbi:PREDICTED: mini-chromosome maintenance complex-binding protein-like [Brassica oleracea var. oleracea]|uniref:mini-chromosome maintenance complex-binding protein-like n=1 Tax=Brassica oleracea var. oleracea TaxID=109376 RepID=UPI0006A725FC|nr:PREDICTED: mini-chromosome maintenance complex-binding protein-like [Brassica oleracea var. oleracea]